MKVALLGSPKTGFDDRQWNQVGYESMMRVKEEMGVEVACSDRVAPLNADFVLRDFAEEGYDLIWANGLQFEDSVIMVAEEYPDTHFAVTGLWKTAPNVCQFYQGRHEGHYLLGMIAGSLTKDNKVGFMIGINSSFGLVPAFVEAGKRGIKAANPDAEISVGVVGGWEDKTRGRKVASTLIEWGANVLLQESDGFAFAVYELCQKKGVYVNGLWFDLYDLAPDVMYSSMITKVDPIIKEALRDIKKDEFKPRYWMTLANGGISLAPYHRLEKIIPDDVKKRVETAKQDIIDGKLYVREW